MEKLIRKYVLQNAIKFGGKPNPKAVIGKVFGVDESLKKKARDVNDAIGMIIEEIKDMPVEDMIEELKKTAPELLEKKEKQKKEMAELPGAEKGKVVTRIPPEPSKYNHLGHALSFLINYIYAKKYDGKCVLRFEDTNPLTAKQEYVDAMKEDVLEYLDIKPDKIVYVSDDMLEFYSYAKTLIEDGQAYVCFCDRDTMKEHREKGMGCGCRDEPNEKNMKEWKHMLDDKYDEGKCVLRMKIDMESKNYVMRDPVIFRICKYEHYKQGKKYIVWPMYDFENAIEEHMCDVTHILRSSEFGKMRIELQEHIKKVLGLNQQHTIQYGRFNVTGAITQGREIREMIEKEEVTGWDDPRLVTLKALKRRGIVKEAFYELVKEVGLSKTQTNLDWNIISAINRKIIDKEVNRYFFMEDPAEIKIEKAPEQKIELDLHPENKKGGRKFDVKDTFYILKDDLKVFKDGELYRLMDCINFRKEKSKFVFDSLEYEKYKKDGKKIIHWLPKTDDLVKVEILMPDNTIKKGLAEAGVNDINVGDVIQFERFGFCRLDSVEDGLKFWFTHK